MKEYPTNYIKENKIRKNMKKTILIFNLSFKCFLDINSLQIIEKSISVINHFFSFLTLYTLFCWCRLIFLIRWKCRKDMALAAFLSILPWFKHIHIDIWVLCSVWYLYFACHISFLSFLVLYIRNQVEKLKKIHPS